MIYEGEPFEDKCQFWVPSAYFGTFSQTPFENIAHLSRYQVLEFIPLLEESPALTFVFRKWHPEKNRMGRFGNVTTTIYPYDAHNSVELLM